MSEDTIKWSTSDMREVTSKQPDDFWKVREELTRMGEASRKEQELCESWSNWQKQGKENRQQ